jgi:hypothetical protein
MLELEARVVFLSYPEGIPIGVMPKLIPFYDDPWVDLDIAQTEFERDTRRCHVFLSDKPSLEDLSKIHRALRKWNWFWAYQHRSPRMREYFRQEAEERPPARLIIPPDDESPDYHSFYKHLVRRKGPTIGSSAPDEGMRFRTEIEASEALERLVRRWFEWEKEVSLEYVEGQRLRIDYLMWPREGVDFPYPMFGVEVKRGYYAIGPYNRALKQAIDYTSC